MLGPAQQLGTEEEDVFRGEKHCIVESGRINLKVTTQIENIEPPTKDLAEQKSQEAVFRTDVKDLTEEMDKKCLALVKFVELTQEEEKNMKMVTDRLKKVFLHEFQEVKIEAYGSSASGLGVHGCDLDLQVSLGPLKATASLQGDRGLLRRLCQLLVLHPSHHYRSARAVLGASTPIVKVKDKVTGLRCDITTAGEMGVLNTRYVSFCIQSDPRVRTLLMVVKVFAFRHDLTGKGRGEHLNSYTLVLMVIFFLQTRGILHPISSLQAVPGLQPRTVNGHNFAFCTEHSLLSPLPHIPSSLLDLLLGFFDYFSTFPYSSSTVCLFAGEAVVSRSPATQYGPPRPPLLVILDPFERRNLAQSVSSRHLGRLTAAFSTAARILVVARKGFSCQELLFNMLFQHGFHSFIKVFQLPLLERFPVLDTVKEVKEEEEWGDISVIWEEFDKGIVPGVEGPKCNKDKRSCKKKSYKIVDI